MLRFAGLALISFLALGAQDPEPPLARGKAKFDEARAAAEKGTDFEPAGLAALAAYDEAVKADPGSVEARTGRGELRASMAAWRMPKGDFTKRAELEAAIVDFDEALKLDVKRAETFAGRGYARWKLAVARMFARGNIDDLFKTAFQDLEQALALKPADAAFHALRGEALLEKGIYARYRADPHKAYADAALVDFAEAAKLDPAAAVRLEPRIAAARKLSESPVAVEDRGPSIIWAKSWEQARLEATIRRVPIFFYVSGGAG